RSDCGGRSARGFLLDQPLDLRADVVPPQPPPVFVLIALYDGERPQQRLAPDHVPLFLRNATRRHGPGAALSGGRILHFSRRDGKRLIQSIDRASTAMRALQRNLLDAPFAMD